MTPPLRYDIAVEGERIDDLLIRWGETPGWATEHRAALDAADRVSLVPKDGEPLPVVSVRLGGGRRWVVFSRVCGQVTGGRQARVYAVGWQATVRGVNVKSLLWVYPDGSVEENAEGPSFVKQFLEK